jgi:asparagine synthase (glutamine-hydrolysing)
MGGISLVIYNASNPPVNIEFTSSFLRMRHRGQDDSYYSTESNTKVTRMNQDQVKLFLSKRQMQEYTPYTFISGFHRMSINDMSKDASQPFEDPILHQVRKYPELRTRPKRKLMCSGEIYNSEELKAQENFTERDLRSGSDCEVILPMYIKYGLEETLRRIDGDFTFVITENIDTFVLSEVNVFVARDILGTRPLYMIKHRDNFFYMFVSEVKGVPKFILEDSMYEIVEVPPGTYWSFQNALNKEGDFKQYSNLEYYKNIDNCEVVSAKPDVIGELYEKIKDKITKATMKRYESSGVPVGVLFSGGFDSSLILSIVAHHTKGPIYAFTVGDETSDDVKGAKRCVEYLEKLLSLDIRHYIITIDDIKRLNGEIDSVIWTIETFDPVTVRSSIPYTVLFKYIKEMTNVRVLLTGEGLDELCGYNELFEYDDKTLQTKSVELLERLARYDLLRCDKIAASYGIELRHPYLDTGFMEYMLSVHPRLKRPQTFENSKRPISKYIVRKAFDNGMLSKDTLWRPLDEVVNCFNESLNKSIDDYFNNLYTDHEYYSYVNLIDSRTRPQSKEEMHYRRTFESMFCDSTHIVQEFWNHIWEK